MPPPNGTPKKSSEFIKPEKPPKVKRTPKKSKSFMKRSESVLSMLNLNLNPTSEKKEKEKPSASSISSASRPLSARDSPQTKSSSRAHSGGSFRRRSVSLSAPKTPFAVDSLNLKLHGRTQQTSVDLFPTDLPLFCTAETLLERCISLNYGKEQRKYLADICMMVWPEIGSLEDILTFFSGALDKKEMGNVSWETRRKNAIDCLVLLEKYHPSAAASDTFFQVLKRRLLHANEWPCDPVFRVTALEGKDSIHITDASEPNEESGNPQDDPEEVDVVASSRLWRQHRHREVAWALFEKEQKLLGEIAPIELIDLSWKKDTKESDEGEEEGNQNTTSESQAETETETEAEAEADANSNSNSNSEWKNTDGSLESQESSGTSSTSPCLVMINHSNRVSSWIVTQVLKEFGKATDRIRALSWAIRLAGDCRKIGNFNAVFEIVGGLNSCPISRLKNIWRGLKKQDRVLFEDLCTFVDSSSNYKTYRSALASFHGPCVPFLGICLTDLTFANEIGHAPGEHEININKVQILGRIVRQVVVQQEKYKEYTKNMPQGMYQPLIVQIDAALRGAYDAEFSYQCSLMITPRKMDFNALDAPEQTSENSRQELLEEKEKLLARIAEIDRILSDTKAE